MISLYKNRLPPLQANSVSLVYLTVLAAFTIAPFCATHILGMGDSLNHLARMHVLANIDRSPDLQRFYTVHWAPIPYLAMDTVLPTLARLTGLYTALKLFVLACVLLPFFAVLALRRAAAERFSASAAAALLLGANYALGLGFLNFVFMAGLAMLAFAAWLATANWPPWLRLAVFAIVALALYFGHAFAFLAYGCAVAGHEIAGAVRARFAPPPRIARNIAIATAQAIPVIAAACLIDPHAGTPGQIYSVWGDPAEKLLAFTSPILFLNDPVQQTVLRVCTVALFGCAAMRFAPRLWPAAAFSFAVALLIPEILLSTWLTDFRLPLTATILLVAAASRGRVPPRARIILYVALPVLIGAKSADAWRVLHVLDAQESAMHRVLQSLPRGARLLVVNISSDPPRNTELAGSTIWTMPLMAVIERDAFVPTLFTGLTTVHVQPAYQNQSTPQGNPTTLARLTEDLHGTAPSLTPEERREGIRIYWHDWPHRFDYVLVEHVHASLPSTLPPQLVPVAFSEDFALYRIAA